MSEPRGLAAGACAARARILYCRSLYARRLASASQRCCTNHPKLRYIHIKQEVRAWLPKPESA
jgi:hypothetical protein